MATSTPGADKPAEPVSQPVQQSLDPNQETTVAATAERSAASVFVNSEPIREDQVQNAVKFLSHPKVKGSPVVYRRSFLEKKGLSREEIDEAFRRVPDAPPASTSVPTATTTLDGQTNISAAAQTVAPAQNLQLAVPVAASKTGLLNRFGWSHAFLAIGLLAASGAGTALLIKKSIIPRLKAWIRKVVSEEDNQEISSLKPTVAEEAAAAAKAAAAAASDVAKVSQDLLSSKHAERRYFEEFQRALDLQVQEMMSMSKSMRKLEEKSYYSYSGEDDPRAIYKKPYSNGRVDVDARPVRSSTPLDNPAPPHSKSYMEILSMVQRGEKPDNIREINDMPPNPNQLISNPRLAPVAKPWEMTQSQQNSSQVFSGDEGYNLQDGLNPQMRGNGSAVARQLRNSRVTEIEAVDDESKVGTMTNNPTPIRRWVPPQPPPVAMPEAAEAIRRPKSSVRKEALSTDDDQASVQSSSDGIDELQRVTKLSELGGGFSENNKSSSLESQEEQEYNNTGDN